MFLQYSATSSFTLIGPFMSAHIIKRQSMTNILEMQAVKTVKNLKNNTYIWLRHLFGSCIFIQNLQIFSRDNKCLLVKCLEMIYHNMLHFYLHYFKGVPDTKISKKILFLLFIKNSN